MKRAFHILCLALVLSGCAGIEVNTAARLKGLSPGMTEDQVRHVMGDPVSEEKKDGKLFMKYSLSETWRDMVPYYMVFDKESGRLVKWYADEEEYKKNKEMVQQMMGGSGGAVVVTAGSAPNNAALMKDVAGTYKVFTEPGSVAFRNDKTLSLCSNGTFYSSDGDGPSSVLSVGQDSGAWTIQGSMEEGSITFIYSDGTSRSVLFRNCSESGGCAYKIGETKYSYSGQSSACK